MLLSIVTKKHPDPILFVVDILKQRRSVCRRDIFNYFFLIDTYRKAPLFSPRYAKTLKTCNKKIMVVICLMKETETICSEMWRKNPKYLGNDRSGDSLEEFFFDRVLYGMKIVQA